MKRAAAAGLLVKFCDSTTSGFHIIRAIASTWSNPDQEMEIHELFEAMEDRPLAAKLTVKFYSSQNSGLDIISNRDIVKSVIALV